MTGIVVSLSSGEVTSSKKKLIPAGVFLPFYFFSFLFFEVEDVNPQLCMLPSRLFPLYSTPLLKTLFSTQTSISRHTSNSFSSWAPSWSLPFHFFSFTFLLQPF